MKVRNGGGSMLSRKKTVLVLVVVLAFTMSACSLAAAQTLDHRSVLSGNVLSVVTTGAVVKEGTVLVMVGTLTGPVPAARATADGVVTEVFVKPGDNIRQGDLVARIEAGRK